MLKEKYKILTGSDIEDSSSSSDTDVRKTKTSQSLDLEDLS